VSANQDRLSALDGVLRFAPEQTNENVRERMQLFGDLTRRQGCPGNGSEVSSRNSGARSVKITEATDLPAHKPRDVKTLEYLTDDSYNAPRGAALG